VALLLGVLVVVSPLFVVANAFGASAEAAATTSTGSVGIRLVDVPVSAANDPRARLYIVDHVAPGAVIERRIEVSNTTSSALRVALYAAAATIGAASFIGEEGHTANDVSSWTSVSPSAPEIPAGRTVTAMVTIAPPIDAAPGERYAVVWAEVGSVPTNGDRVIEVNRVGVRVYLSVGRGGSPASDFAIDSLTAERSDQGRPVVVAAVHNTGGRALDVSGTLQLSSGPGGLSAGPFPASLGVTLAIADTKQVTITLDEVVPAGPWNARVTLRSGLIQRSATATITFPSNGVSAPVKTATAHRASDRGAIAGAVALALLASAAAGVLLLRQRRAAKRWLIWRPPRSVSQRRIRWRRA
jgi:hypothetical protein